MSRQRVNYYAKADVDIASITVTDIKQVYLIALDMEVKGINVYGDKSLPDSAIVAYSIKSEECS